MYISVRRSQLAMSLYSLHIGLIILFLVSRPIQFIMFSNLSHVWENEKLRRTILFLFHIRCHQNNVERKASSNNRRAWFIYCKCTCNNCVVVECPSSRQHAITVRM